MTLPLQLIGRPPRLLFVPPWELQDRFNAGRYWERALAGEFLCRVRPLPRKRRIERPDEPVGTVAMMVDFYRRVNDDEAVFVFRADVVLRPDGSFGGRDAILGRSARPDPKKLAEDGVTYCFRKPTPEETAAFLSELQERKE